MTIRHLNIFVAVADYGSMSAAATHLYLSQPTVSQAIRELEKHYNVLREFDSCIIKIVRAGRIKPVLFLSSFSLYYLVIFSDM